ncbi:hypothetical protein [Mesorhizobium sp.]|nr:hypothetical protein [Mesorhizobium sp.]
MELHIRDGLAVPGEAEMAAHLVGKAFCVDYRHQTAAQTVSSGRGKQFR